LDPIMDLLSSSPTSVTFGSPISQQKSERLCSDKITFAEFQELIPAAIQGRKKSGITAGAGGDPVLSLFQ
jgi:hypothetical protein